MPRSRGALALSTLVLLTAVASAQDREDADRKDPPPLGTASFTPPEVNTKQQPLTPEIFVMRAAVTNMAEIELGQLALERSADPGVRQFAAQLVKDHQAAQVKLKSVAAAAKIALPGTVDDEHRMQKEKLSELVGADFDKQFVTLMKTGHQKALGLFNAASKSAELDTAFKNYATETLATVKTHASQADRLHAAH
jgi:putative membrane protein